MVGLKRVKAIGMLLLVGVSVLSSNMTVYGGIPYERDPNSWGKYANRQVFHYSMKEKKKYVAKVPKTDMPDFRGKDKEKKIKAWNHIMEKEKRDLEVQQIGSAHEYYNNATMKEDLKMEEIVDWSDERECVKFKSQFPKPDGSNMLVDFIKPLKGAKYSGGGYTVDSRAAGVVIDKKWYLSIGGSLKALGFEEVDKKDVPGDEYWKDRGYISQAERKHLGDDKYRWLRKTYIYDDTQEGGLTRIFVYATIDSAYDSKASVSEIKDYFYTKAEYDHWKKSSPYKLYVADYSRGRGDKRFQVLKDTLKITHRWDLDTKKYKGFMTVGGRPIPYDSAYGIYSTPLKKMGMDFEGNIGQIREIKF